MYYERQILPIDKHGHFLIALHFPQHKIGGEISRESAHAFFAYGHVDHPEHLTDITAMCTLPREASQQEESYYRQMALGQSQLAQNYQDSSPYRKQYQHNAWQFDYQAKLAQSACLYVPRKVLASLNGILALGIPQQFENGGGSGSLRIIDLFANKILAEHHESNAAKVGTLCYPSAFALNGAALVMRQHSAGAFNSGLSYAEVDALNLRSKHSFSKPSTLATFLAGSDTHWIAIDEKQVLILEIASGKALTSHPLPRGCYGWTASMAANGHDIAFAAGNGQISLLNLNDGSTRRFFPHRGCKRDDFASIKISANGEWMASRIFNQAQLVITRLADGVSWPLLSLHDQTVDESVDDNKDGKFRPQSSLPATFAFIGDKLLVSDSPLSTQSQSVRHVELQVAGEKDSAFVSEQGRPGARKPIKIPAKANFEKLIAAAHLERLKQELEKHYSPAAKLVCKKPKASGWLMPGKKGAPELGASRFGGWPDLPQGQAWPTWQNRPMSFLAQINLTQAHDTQSGLRLPQQGLLLFFLGCNDQIYDNKTVKRETYMADAGLGSEPGNKDAWRVIYAPDIGSLERTVYPQTPAPELFAPCMLTLTRGGMSLPDEYAAAYASLDCTPAERDDYNELIGLLASDDMSHQLMGYPILIQSTPPDLQCELAATGQDPFRFPDENSDEYKKLASAASEWGLLLQLTSDDKSEFLWGDAGNIFFYGKRKEIEQGNFSNVWVNFECH